VLNDVFRNLFDGVFRNLFIKLNQLDHDLLLLHGQCNQLDYDVLLVHG
jgi:hypothetical protein